jgi:hypothetical protein
LSAQSKGDFELELRADRTASVSPTGTNAPDDRELSVAVCNIAIHQ